MSHETSPAGSGNVPAVEPAREATSETPTGRDPDVCTLCDAFGRPGRLALATMVCDTCGYDPHGYYADDCTEPIEASR